MLAGDGITFFASPTACGARIPLGPGPIPHRLRARLRHKPRRPLPPSSSAAVGRRRTYPGSDSESPDVKRWAAEVGAASGGDAPDPCDTTTSVVSASALSEAARGLTLSVLGHGGDEGAAAAGRGERLGH